MREFLKRHGSEAQSHITCLLGLLQNFSGLQQCRDGQFRQLNLSFSKFRGRIWSCIGGGILLTTNETSQVGHIFFGNWLLRNVPSMFTNL